MPDCHGNYYFCTMLLVQVRGRPRSSSSSSGLPEMYYVKPQGLGRSLSGLPHRQQAKNVPLIWITNGFAVYTLYTHYHMQLVPDVAVQSLCSISPCMLYFLFYLPPLF